MFHSSEFLLDPAPSVAEHLDPRRVFAETDRKINPGPPAQRFMRPPLSRYIALAQRRTIGAYVASRAIIGKVGALASPSAPANSVEALERESSACPHAPMGVCHRPPLFSF